jgi:uncharacterized protein YlxP (DUF503 family)
MKKAFLVLMFLTVCGMVHAQCVAEIKDVVQDEIRGSIVVITEYTLNGKVVQEGKTRYDENSGTNEEIIAKAKEDIAIHCENLIRRIEANKMFKQVESLKIQKALTEPIITSIKPSLVGFSTSKTEVKDIFKGNEIKVTADAKNTVSAVSVIDK